jgi:acetyl esterase/lipase
MVLRDGTTKSTLKIFKPSPSSSGGVPGPLIALIFSGAFIAGSDDQVSDIARALVTLFRATVVSVNYRLAPEHKFPTAQHDAIDSVRWVAENATSSLLSADLSE